MDIDHLGETLITIWNTLRFCKGCDLLDKFGNCELFTNSVQEGKAALGSCDRATVKGTPGRKEAEGVFIPVSTIS